VNRIDRPRVSVRGDVMATFYPRCFTWFNSRCGRMFLRKWRGNRKRGRAWQLATQDRKRALIASFTPGQLDYLVQAVTTKLSGKNSVSIIALDRKQIPMMR